MRYLNSSTIGSFLLLLVFLALWQWGPGWLSMPEFVLPKFTRVLQEFGHMWTESRLLYHTGITALEIVVGFLLGSLLGLVVAVPSFKVRGDYLAIITLAFLMIER